MKARVNTSGVFLNAYDDGYNFPSDWIVIDITNEEYFLINELGKCKKENGVWIKIEDTEEEIQYQLIKKRTQIIKEKYEFHRANGWAAYQEFRAKVVSDIYDGLITETEAFIIESNLKVAYDRISQNGDWKTARFELSQVTPYPAFVQPYFDMAMNYINNYISINYED